MVVVGFGAAGACAALEAARRPGPAVIVLDRFNGGGATALSGGVVYAGGGTPQQRAAGVSDSAEAMFGYLSTEVGDVVSAATLRAFCDGSPAMLAWLEATGCRSRAACARTRRLTRQTGTTCTTREVSCPFGHIAPPAPRGHRAQGRGTSGRLLFARLAAAVRRSGATSCGRPGPSG